MSVLFAHNPYGRRKAPKGRAYCYETRARNSFTSEEVASAARILRLEERHSFLLAKIRQLREEQPGAALLRFLPRGRCMVRPGMDPPDPLGDRLIEIHVDLGAALACEAQRWSIMASGKLPFFSVGHDSNTPAFYPSVFFWDDSVFGGVMAAGDYTAHGLRFLYRGRETYFSPSIGINRFSRSGFEARITCVGWDLGANMGAFLPSKGAFGDALRVRVTA